MTTVALDDSVFVYDEDAHRFYKLNSSAAAIYESCDGVNSVDEIAARLAEQHLAGLPNVRADVLETITGLAELGLVTER
jgi:hypothetical protein